MNSWGEDKRICNGCDPPTIKPIEEFRRLGSNWDHLCRECRNKYQRGYYERYREKILWTKKVKTFVLKKQSGILTLNP